MLPLKELIFNEVRVNHEKSTTYTDQQLDKLIFRRIDGLRLTLSGFIIIKNIFTAYSFKIPSTLKSRHQMSMSNMEFPYFLTSKRLVLFSEIDASVIALSGGIEIFLENCSHIGK